MAGTDDILIRPETAADADAALDVQREAFGTRGDEVAELVQAVRARGRAVHALVTVQGPDVVGHVLLSRCSVDTARTGGALGLRRPSLRIPEAGSRRGRSRGTRTG